jgi:hypothetical protein
VRMAECAGQFDEPEGDEHGGERKGERGGE